MEKKLSTILLALVFYKDFYEYIDHDFHFFLSYFEDMVSSSEKSCWSDIFDEIANDDWGAKYINFVYDELQNFY